MENAYTLSTEETLKRFDVTEETGLSDARVSAQREKYGSNGNRTLKAAKKFQTLTWRFRSFARRTSYASVAVGS